GGSGLLRTCRRELSLRQGFTATMFVAASWPTQVQVSVCRLSTGCHGVAKYWQAGRVRVLRARNERSAGNGTSSAPKALSHLGKACHQRRANADRAEGPPKHNDKRLPRIPVALRVAQTRRRRPRAESD